MSCHIPCGVHADVTGRVARAAGCSRALAAGPQQGGITRPSFSARRSLIASSSSLITQLRSGDPASAAPTDHYLCGQPAPARSCPSYDCTCGPCTRHWRGGRRVAWRCSSQRSRPPARPALARPAGTLPSDQPPRRSARPQAPFRAPLSARASAGSSMSQSAAEAAAVAPNAKAAAAGSGEGTLARLRQELGRAAGGHGVDAFIIPSEDPHMVREQEALEASLCAGLGWGVRGRPPVLVACAALTRAARQGCLRKACTSLVGPRLRL